MKRNIKGISEEKNYFLNETWIEKNTTVFLLLIVAVSFLVFSPCLKNGFLIYDDVENVTDNVYISSFSAEHVKTFFTTPLLYMYTPLVYISFAIDYMISGLNPIIFHLTNVILHLVNILLVFIFIKLLSDKREAALITAALFAIHPLMADTVAWISTRSNLLFTLFFLASMISYLYYLKNNLRLKFYYVSLILLVFSTLSKSAAAVLPFVLLIIDYYKEKKFNIKTFAEKIPFFIIAIAAAAITIYFRTDVSTSQTPFVYSLPDKFFILCYSFFAFLTRIIFPFNLSAVYSYPEKTGAALPFEFYAATLLFIILAVAVIRMKHKEIRFGILFFLISITVSQVGFLEDGFTANRYAYLPSIGLFFIISTIYSSLNKKTTYLIFFFVFLSISALLSYNRAGVWKDNITLFNDVIDKEPGNAFAYNLRGISKYGIKDYTGSVEDYSHAIVLNKKYPGAFYNRALSNYAIGNFSKSLDDYTTSIELNPNSAKSYLGRGIIKMDILKNYDAAIRDYNKALELNPYFPQAYYNRGLAKLRTEKIAEACEDFRKVKQFGYSQANELIQKFCN